VVGDETSKEFERVQLITLGSSEVQTSTSDPQTRGLVEISETGRGGKMFRSIARATATLCLCAAGIAAHQYAFGMPLLILSNYGDGLIQDVDSNGNITTRISGLVSPEGIAVNTSGRLFVNNYVVPANRTIRSRSFYPMARVAYSSRDRGLAGVH